MTTTKLFDPKIVNKFWDILEKKGRVCNNLYRGYDTLNPHIVPCDKEVFINRTIGKWFKGKYIILYKEEKGLIYNQYINISLVKYSLRFSDSLTIYYFDFGCPYNVYDVMIINKKDLLKMEGKWCESPADHVKIFEILTNINEPYKEYVYRYYDMTKIKKKSTLVDYEKQISFIAKTEAESKKKFEQWITDNLYMSDLIEVREIVS